MIRGQKGSGMSLMSVYNAQKMFDENKLPKRKQWMLLKMGGNK